MIGTSPTLPPVSPYAVAYAAKAFPKSSTIALRSDGSRIGMPT